MKFHAAVVYASDDVKATSEYGHLEPNSDADGLDEGVSQLDGNDETLFTAYVNTAAYKQNENSTSTITE